MRTGVPIDGILNTRPPYVLPTARDALRFAPRVTPARPPRQAPQLRGTAPALRRPVPSESG
eukprot:scaffold68893_cov60-Phaeocystis_antarctica.AAC.1